MTDKPLRKKRKKRVIARHPDGTVRVRPLSKKSKEGTFSWAVRNVNKVAANDFVAYCRMRGVTTGEGLTRILKISNTRSGKENNNDPQETP